MNYEFWAWSDWEFSFLLLWLNLFGCYWLIKLCKSQVHNSITHHMLTTLERGIFLQSDDDPPHTEGVKLLSLPKNHQRRIPTNRTTHHKDARNYYKIKKRNLQLIIIIEFSKTNAKKELFQTKSRESVTPKER